MESKVKDGCPLARIINFCEECYKWVRYKEYLDMQKQIMEERKQ